MKTRLQGLVIGILIGTTLASSIAFAKTETKWIEALYNNIKIYVDGVKIEPKDATGNTVEPFIYNGTTYLPVRAISEALGKNVSWDGTTQSVYIGEKPGDEQYLLDVCPPYQTSNYSEYTLQNGKSFQMSGKKYTNGFTIGSYTSNNGHALFNLDGKYDSLTLDVGHVDETAEKDITIHFYVDEKLVEEVEIKATALSKKITIPLNKGLQLKVEVPYNDMFYPDPTIGFGNVILK